MTPVPSSEGFADRDDTAESWQFDRVPVVTVPLDSLQVAQSPRVAGEDPEHVRVLAETTSQLPPIIVHRPTMRVIDGMHRLRAAELRQRHDIEVRFFDGDETDAFVLAVRSNIAHGLPLSLADRKSAALLIIASHPDWSDRRIAGKTGLAAKTVGSLRTKHGDRSPESRVGQDGKVRPVNSAQGRRLAGELMTDDPHLSLREVARAAGISPETARDVRRRLTEGQDPVPSAKRDRTGRRRPATRPQPDLRLPTTIHQLSSDPALRLNAAGRALLKILNANGVVTERFDRLVDNVPDHCRDAVARAARDCAQVWRTFATELEDG
jgi:ParB-like chromosome segregation protein Spo0J